MNDPNTGLIGAAQAMLGGAATSLVAAGLGRLVYHGHEVRAGRRSLFGWHFVWEVPTAVVMAIVAESVSGYLGLSPQTTTGVVAVLSYLGPRGAQAMGERLFLARPKG